MTSGAVLDERARVAQVLDVLARRALTRLAPARDRLGPRRVESDHVAFVHFGQVRSHMIQIDDRTLSTSEASTSRSSTNASG